jgi:hypothetical protein
VLDIILERVIHVLIVKGNYPIILEKVLYIYFYFYFHFKDYVVPYGTVVKGILDMRPGKHDLHFLVGVELLPHAFVNIPDEKIHIGVFLYIFIFYFIFVFYLYFKNYLYIFIRSFPLVIQL